MPGAAIRFLLTRAYDWINTPADAMVTRKDPLAYLRDGMGRRGGEFFDKRAWAEYERCIARPGTAAGICADYRAGAGIDLDHDRADREAGRRVTQPLRVLWGANGVVGRCFEPLKLWQAAAENVSGRAVDSGHYIAEEAPDEVLTEAAHFFNGDE